MPNELPVNSIDFLARRDFLYGPEVIKLSVIFKDEAGTYGFLPWPTEFTKHPDHYCIPDSAIQHVSLEAAQSLMDQLWDCGLRPTQAAGSAGAMEAVQNHLADMRKIAAAKLKVEF